MKSHNHVIVFLAISTAVLILAASNSVVYAQPCIVTLSQPVIPTQYSNPNVPFVIPVSASCTAYYSQLYATGNAFDATTNTGLGTANTNLLPVNGGQQFNGQLGFSVLPTSPTDSVQVSVSLYDNQGGNLITQNSETVQVGTGAYQPTQPPIQQITTTVGQIPATDPPPTDTQPPYQPPYPSSYPPNQPQYYQNPEPAYRQQGYWNPTYYYSQGFPYRSHYQYLFDIAIILIFATAVIATIGLVLIGRRRQPPQGFWYPCPPPPPPR